MTDPIAPLINALHAQGRLRVWSLVITVFGDLVQHRGGEISTARLGKVLGRAGIEPGTLRTALSRLGRDGWVTRTRAGRSSYYRLSLDGLARFAPATTRIYAPPRHGDVQEWALSLHLDPGGGQRFWLHPADDWSDTADLRMTGTLEQISDAYRAALLSPEHRAALVDLRADLVTLEEVKLSDPLDAATARMLLIHRWRRIVLRHPEIAPQLMPQDAPLADPRSRVAEVYRALTLMAETWLDSGLGDDGAMPPADARFETRFGGL